MHIKSRNFLLFRTAQATVKNQGQEVTVKGFRFIGLPGRYRIGVEEGYGYTPLPKSTRRMIETVRTELRDKHDLPKRIRVKPL